MRHKIAGTMHEVAVQDRHGRGSMTLDGMGQGGKMRILALVPRQAAGDIQHRAGLDRQDRIVAEGEGPGFAQVRHGHVWSSLERSMLEAQCIPVDQREGAHRIVEVSDRLGRCTGQLVPFSITQHATIPPPQPASALATLGTTLLQVAEKRHQEAG